MIENDSKGVDQQGISLKVSLAARLQGQVVCEVMALIPGAHGAGWSCSLHSMGGAELGHAQVQNTHARSWHANEGLKETKCMQQLLSRW